MTENKDNNKISGKVSEKITQKLIHNCMKEQKKQIRNNLKKVLLCVLICLVIILLIPVACYGIVNLSQSRESVPIEHIQSLAVRDAAVVPGTSGYEGSVSTKAKDRLLAALKLYEAGLVSRIIVSGDEKEARTLSQVLMKKGVPSEHIYSDAYGLDTYDTIARVRDKFGDLSLYFCTQELYSSRAAYLMEHLGADGIVVCVDTMYYDGAGKSAVREFFACTKAVFEPLLLFGKAKTSMEKEAFIEVEQPVENPHFVYADELETPEDCIVADPDPDDGYDVYKAVAYARTYAYEHNAAYGQFEQNCTNFVSQCLVEGGIVMQGEMQVSDTKRWSISGDKKEWYSGSKLCERDGLMHYSVSESFIKTEAFFKYFTEERGYELTVYDNDDAGKQKCYEEMAAGDVLILYDEEGSVTHLGLVSGIGDKNAYYCGNTADRRDFSVFSISDQTYSRMGILHMSEKSGPEQSLS